MPLSCLAPPADAPILSGLVGYVDCQAEALGTLGFKALAAPGSSVAFALSGLLGVFVALIGYRMLLGEAPGLRQAVLWMVRIGIVLTLASAWPAFSVLVYRVATLGPVQLAGEIARPVGLPGANGDLVERLQAVLDGLDRVRDQTSSAPSIQTPGASSRRTGRGGGGEDPDRPVAGVDASNVAASSAALAPSTLVISAARFVFLVSSLGALLSVRIITGLLLALAPLFAALLLFDTTRGLFEGWVRGLVATALGALATRVTLGVEVSVIEPMVSRALDAPARAISGHGASEDLLVVVTIFALSLAVGLAISARVAAGFRTPWPRAADGPAWTQAPQARQEERLEREPRSTLTLAEPPSRAAVIAGALIASERRERSPATPAVIAGDRRDGAIGAERDYASEGAPLGQSHRRSTRQRASLSAGRRDARG